MLLRSSLLLPTLVLSLVACTEPAGDDSTSKDSPVDTGDFPDPPVDADGDGWSIPDGDCDDADAAVHPGAAEACNDADDNCDGRTDEGLPDTDGDGTPDCRATESCDGRDNNGDGQVDEGSPDVDMDGVADCVDVEACDGVDNDGDGQADEGFDGDGDGYPSCAECDDGDGDVHPDRDDPDDGVDNDCDGLVDEGAWNAGDLVITEIMANPQAVGDPDGEWVELYNPTGGLLTLDGLTLRAGADEVAIDPPYPLSVGPGDYVVLGGAADTSVNGGVRVDWAYSGLTLSNGSGSVAILADGQVVAERAWDDGATMPDAVGASMSLDPWLLDAGDDPASWCAATTKWSGSIGDFGSPGEANELCSTIDHDLDGYSGDQGDCADDDDTIFPTATDTWYDGVDQDCDGLDDYDQDQDGYQVDDDCDDTEPTVHPGAVEVCDDANLDEDCNDVADDDDAGVTKRTTFYADGDDDGYGDDDVTVSLCDMPDGYATTGGDCDDATVLANPGTTEVCADGIDNDCDGTPNACGFDVEYTTSAGEYTAKYVGDAMNDASGYAVAGMGDLDGDGVGSIAIGAYGDRTGGTNAGAVFVLSGDASGVTDMGGFDARFYGEDTDDGVGKSVAVADDADGDGWPDLFLAAPGDDDAGAASGAAYLVSGGQSGSVDLASASAKFYGKTSGDAAGTSVASAGDLDDDGLTDLLVGAPTNDDGGSNAGVAYAWYGPALSSGGLDSSNVVLLGETKDDQAGFAVAGGQDVDGDGVPDFLVGAPYSDLAIPNAGAVYLVSGARSGTIDLSVADMTLTGERSNDGAGASIALPGDTDGDGYSEILVGVKGYDPPDVDRGIVYVVSGYASGVASLSTADATWTGESSSAAAGASVAGVGDLDGDGWIDIGIGATGMFGSGAAYLVYGGRTGANSLADADVVIKGETGSDQFGISVAAARDADGDGYADLIVGAYQSDSGGSNSGSSYLFLGGPGL